MTDHAPLDRAAAALAASMLALEERDDDIRCYVYVGMPDWKIMARAVLEAVREPSDMMLAAGHLAGAAFPWGVWEGMIDSALVEKTD